MKKALIIANMLFVSASVLTVSAMNYPASSSYNYTKPATKVIVNNKSENSRQKKNVQMIKSFENLKTEATRILENDITDTTKIALCIKDLTQKIVVLNQKITQERRELLSQKQTNKGKANRIIQNLNAQIVTKQKQLKILSGLINQLDNRLKQINEQKDGFSLLNTIKSGFMNLVSFVEKTLKTMVLSK